MQAPQLGKIVLIVLLLFSFFTSVKTASAADFNTSYKAEYFLNNNEQSITAKVLFTISLTNSRSDVYVKKINLFFPKSFVIKNVKASDDKRTIQPLINTDDSKINIQLEFTDPSVGKGNANNFFLEFDQENLFKINGNVWEVILPTIEDESRSSYQAIVHLPPDTDRKIAISKPKPDEIRDNTIFWNNPKEKTIYAVFGEKQYYETGFTYHLKNTRITPIYTEVAFPPDTLFQKIHIKSISPLPSQVRLDEDGNYMGKYFLKPKEQLDILFNGTIEVVTNPRSEVIPSVQENFQTQKKYLLTQKAYWQLPSKKIEVGKTPGEIYQFVVNKLKYNYQRVNNDIKRLGAITALETPDQAVCVEFTDTFIALAREKGVFSREIQGYGFSNDPQLRPLSLVSDILHSWPEYFDERKGYWTPIDPTWESTSGIDYFSSFDLNHIALAIHGKRPDYPLPAGSYKIEESRDIKITATSVEPKDNVKLDINSLSIPQQLVDNKIYKSKIQLRNNGNVYLYNVPVEIVSDNLLIAPGSFNVSVIAPYEKKDLEFSYSSKIKNKKIIADVSVSVMGDKIYSGKVVILPFYYKIGLYFGYVIIVISIAAISIKLLKRTKSTS